MHPIVDIVERLPVPDYCSNTSSEETCASLWQIDPDNAPERFLL